MLVHAACRLSPVVYRLSPIVYCVLNNGGQKYHTEIAHELVTNLYAGFVATVLAGGTEETIRGCR